MNYSGNVITKNPVQPSLTSAPGVWSLQEAQNAVANGTWPIPGVINPISKSLRFNSADSAYLNRTPASASNRKTWTWSAWIKRSAITALSPLFTVSQDGNNFTLIRFGPGTQDKLELYTITAQIDYSEETVALFRDVSAWYHVVFSVDTTQATAANRIRIYVNGTQQTTTQVYGQIPQNQDTFVNTTNAHNIGRNTDTTTQHFNGYMTEINFIDGQALTPSSFGLTDPNTGVWVPKKYTGTYGTNGFYLNFSDSSSTTLLGYDYSGNGNNWTPNNFSVTAGAGNDSLTDVPTLWTPSTVTSDTGGVLRGNYATFNPLNSQIVNGSLENGNLTLNSTTTTNYYINSKSTLAASSFSNYCEMTVTTRSNTNGLIGIAIGNSIANIASGSGSYITYRESGQVVQYPGGSTLATVSSYTQGDIIGMTIDSTNVKFYKNNTLQGTYAHNYTGDYFVVGLAYNNGGTVVVDFNFGQRPFAYTPPSGYKSLCTTNLPTPTIGAASTALAGNYFNAITYTGTGSALGVTGVGFQPDFVWIKSRSASTDHALYDAVRGVQKQVESNTTTVETTETQGLTAFDTNGFNLGTLAQVNTVNATYVGWNWKAGSSNVTNTSGSITSTVRANTTAGFSVVTYTGNGGVATVGHGLGTKPHFILTKTLNNTEGWGGYHTSLGASYGIFLDLSDAAFASSGYWNNTEPTSTVFTINGNPRTGANAYTYVAYCFTPIAGYSAFGSYTGNGSADGPFVYLGFRPKFILFKRTNASGNDWRMTDTTRSTYNPDNAAWLYPNQNYSENTNANDDMDILSNGFKIRVTADASNNNGSTYIYAAFAESPFKFANAR